ncbi:MAG: flagellar biosynthesis protein FlhF [Gammaproteobacteria bacterium]|nr:flagellar biosynthesis protein FlhF [Gammaproteobacteria bacterium]
MKIKRFMDTDMRHVLRRVREEQGPDAVILSNRRVDGGIEVIAAVDYDEALVQQALGSNIDFTEYDSDAPAVDESPDDASVGNAADVEILNADLRQADDTEASLEDDDVTPETAPEQPSIVQMQSDLSSLRDLLETQLSGLVWKDKSRRSPLQAQMLRNLSRIGMAPDIANIIANRTAPVDNQKDLWRAPLVTLTHTIPIVEDELLSEGGVAALVGPTGVGKTTTIAKMAARYAMEYGSDDIALICADAYRIGAKEHLMAFANIIGAKVHAASTPDELTQLLERLKSKKLVLVDTEGLSQRDLDLSSRLAAFGNSTDRVRFYLTLSATCQEAGLDEIVRRFSGVPLAGAVVTKIDEAGQLGCILSALIRHNLPMSYVADGQRIPDDLHLAHKKRLWLVNQAVECMESSEPKVSERIMAEQYMEVNAANA